MDTLTLPMNMTSFNNLNTSQYPKIDEDLLEKYKQNRAISNTAYNILIIAYTMLIILGSIGNFFVITAIKSNKSKFICMYHTKTFFLNTVTLWPVYLHIVLCLWFIIFNVLEFWVYLTNMLYYEKLCLPVWPVYDVLKLDFLVKLSKWRLLALWSQNTF